MGRGTVDIDAPNPVLNYMEVLLTSPPPPPAPAVAQPRAFKVLTPFFLRASHGRRVTACQGGIHLDGPPPSVTLTGKTLEPAWTPGI